MAFEALTILEILVLLAWACIETKVNKHELFKQIFVDITVLFEIASTASLTFCPGLLDVVQAASPPDIGFFKSLPSARSLKKWGIYALVLEKDGHRPRVYIGSGTSVIGGVGARVLQHKLGSNSVAYRVKAFLKDGYTITHRGVLVWAHIPKSSAEVPRLRLLFVALEAAFSFFFWAMHSEKKDYGMGACCYWSRTSFTYRGLCSHSPLSESVCGDFDLTKEQLEAMAADIQERNRLYHVEYRKKQLLEDPERVRLYHQKYYQQQLLEDPEKLRESARKAYDKYKTTDKRKVSSKNFETRRRESQEYHCSLCGVTCVKERELTRHNKSKAHLKKVALQSQNLPIKLSRSAIKQQKAKSRGKFVCRLCIVPCSSQYELNRHNKSKKHLAKEKKVLDTVRSSSRST